MDRPAPPAPAWRPFSRRFLALALLATAVSSLLLFTYRYLDGVATGHPRRMLEVALEEGTGSMGFLFAVLVMVFVVSRIPLERSTWLRRAPWYLVTVLALGVGQTLFNFATRKALWPLVGLGHYDYGNLWWRFPMEFGLQAIGYAAAIGLIHSGRYYAATREAQAKAAELEAALAKARLEALQARFEPHFLFNALNTISSVMYYDVAEADRLLSRLADLLRQALSHDGRAMVPLSEEIAWLEAYLALMRGRFGDRLAILVKVDPAVAAALVPRFVLQPLVENSIQHGVAARSGPGKVEVEAERGDRRLVLEVRDDGPGPGNGSTKGNGIGLRDTEARLSLAYGADHRLVVLPRPAGGTTVRIEIPFGPARA